MEEEEEEDAYSDDYEDEEFEEYDDDDFEDYEDDDDFEDEEVDMEVRETAPAPRQHLKVDEREQSSASAAARADLKPGTRASSGTESRTKSVKRLVKEEEEEYEEYVNVVQTKRGLFIPAVSESEEKKAAHSLRTRQRLEKWTALVGNKAIQLKISPVCCLVNMEPLSARQVAGRGLGSYANVHVRQTQTDIERTCATQVSTMSMDCSVQVPEEMDYASSLSRMKSGRDENSSSTISRRKAGLHSNRVASLMSALSKTDLNVRLSAMLKRTLPYISESLGEYDGAFNSASRLFSAAENDRQDSLTSSCPLSKSHITLRPGEISKLAEKLCAERTIVAMRYSYDRSQLLVAYSERSRAARSSESEAEAEEDSVLFPEDGFVILWDLMGEDNTSIASTSTSIRDDGHSGQKRPSIHGMLICQCGISCVCWGPYGTATIVAGLTNGAVAVWDLSDPPTSVASADNCVDKVWRESATTEYKTDAGVGRVAGITCSPDLSRDRREALAEVQTNDINTEREEHGIDAPSASATLSFSVISTDEFASIRAWTVTLVLNLDPVKSTLEGTRIGSRASIIHVTDEIQIGVRKGDASSTGLATCVETLPGQSVQFVIGSSGGVLLRGARFGRASAPRMWKPDFSGTSTHEYDLLGNVHSRVAMRQNAVADGRDASSSASTHAGAAVVAVSFSPFVDGLLAVGYQNGSIAIFVLSSSQQVALISETTSVVALQWSAMCPGTLISLDASSHVHLHDVLSRIRDEQSSDKLVISRAAEMELSSVSPSSVVSPSASSMDVTRSDGRRATHLVASPAHLPAALRRTGKKHVAHGGMPSPSSRDATTHSLLPDDSEKTVAIAYEDGSIELRRLEEAASVQSRGTPEEVATLLRNVVRL